MSPFLGGGMARVLCAWYPLEKLQSAGISSDSRVEGVSVELMFEGVLSMTMLIEMLVMFMFGGALLSVAFMVKLFWPFIVVMFIVSVLSSPNPAKFE